MTTTQEQVALLRRWADALESGKYSQAMEVLKNRNGGYCCLGVLCDISGAGKWTNDNFYSVNDYDSDAFLPEPLRTAVALDPTEGLGARADGNPWVSVMRWDGQWEDVPSLGRLNDVYDWDFPQIADVIRTYAAELEEGAVAG